MAYNKRCKMVMFSDVYENVSLDLDLNFSDFSDVYVGHKKCKVVMFSWTCQ